MSESTGKRDHTQPQDAVADLGLEDLSLETQMELAALRKTYTNLVVGAQFARDSGLKDIKVEIDGAVFTVPAAAVDSE